MLNYQRVKEHCSPRFKSVHPSRKAEPGGTTSQRPAHRIRDPWATLEDGSALAIKSGDGEDIQLEFRDFQKHHFHLDVPLWETYGRGF